MLDLSALGKRRRLGQLLRPPSQRVIVVAVDHGLFMGPVAGARVLTDTLTRLAEARPDAVQLTAGSIRRCAHIESIDALPFVMRLDTTNAWRTGSLAPSPGYWAPVAAPADAARAGAAAAVAFLLGGWPDDELERRNVETLARWGRECDELGLPFMIEPLPLGGKVESNSDAELVRTLSRMAAELGCDLLKVDFDGNHEAFAELVADIHVPVLARGGPKSPDPDAYLEAVTAALDAGASGVVVGRNVFDQADPSAMLHALAALVHNSTETVTA